jgi:myosin heavy subunit
VVYDVNGWNDKNTDTLNSELLSVLELSESVWVNQLVEIYINGKRQDDTPPSPGTPRSKRAPSGHKRSKSNLREESVGSQFKSQLHELVKYISTSEPHYVRCVKPNGKKKPDRFEAAVVLRQLKYAGMFETIRIRNQGYAVRMDLDDFYVKFSLLEPSAKCVPPFLQNPSFLHNPSFLPSF